jgi:glucose-6-phosphate isomerase
MPTHLQAWKDLEAHAEEMRDVDLRDLFAADPDRFTEFSLSMGPAFLDYSKQPVTGRTMNALFRLAREAGVPERMEAMFSGERINTTEDRSVLHVALRDFSGRSVYVDGEDVMPDVRAVYERMRDFCDRVRSGERRGHTGKPVTDVVNIGIGGSDLGPRMAMRALEHLDPRGPRAHFVANVDPMDLERVLRELDPERTLFIVASKTFTTQETMANARAARQWLLERLGDESSVAAHFVAVSTNTERVREFGIDPENMFRFWDWVGGRFSLWSAIGLSIALAVGPERYEELLRGAHLVDEHFRTAPLEKNLPVIMALLGIWQVNFRGAETHRSCPTARPWNGFPPICSRQRWRATARARHWTARPPDATLDPWSGEPPGPTASTPSSSSCTRERGGSPATSSGSPAPAASCRSSTLCS